MTCNNELNNHINCVSQIATKTQLMCIKRRIENNAKCLIKLLVETATITDNEQLYIKHKANELKAKSELVFRLEPTAKSHLFRDFALQYIHASNLDLRIAFALFPIEYNSAFHAA